MEGALVLVGRYIGRCMVKRYLVYSYQYIGWKVHGVYWFLLEVAVPVHIVHDILKCQATGSLCLLM